MLRPLSRASFSMPCCCLNPALLPHNSRSFEKMGPSSDKHRSEVETCRDMVKGKLLEAMHSLPDAQSPGALGSCCVSSADTDANLAG